MVTIGERIKLKRKEKGWTQLELANKLLITDRAVSKWEQNEGNPDISLLPAIAELFNVSIDYLLTGEADKKEVITMTPKENLIKNDDPQMLKQVKDLTIKEIYDNELINVFSYLVDNNRAESYFATSRHFDFSKYGNEIIYMSLISNRLDKVGAFRFNDIGFAEPREWTEKSLKALVNDSRVTDNTRNYILESHCRKLLDHGSLRNIDISKGTWQIMYPIFLNEFTVGKKYIWTKKILDEMLKVNEQGHKKYEMSKNDNNYYRCEYSFRPESNFDQYCSKIPVIEISHNVMHMLLTDNEYNLLEIANKINKLVGKDYVTDRAIELHKNAIDMNKSDLEKFKFECVDNKIININALEKSRDLTFVRSILDENYFNYYEYVFDLLTKQKYKDLYQFFVDNEFFDLAEKMATTNGYDQVLGLSWVFFKSEKGSEEYKNHKEFIERQNKTGIETSANGYRYDDSRLQQIRNFEKENGSIRKCAFDLSNRNPIIKLIERLKENIYDSVKLKIENNKKLVEEQKKLENASKDLPKSYFLDLYDKRDTELIVIKLCALIDAYFLYDYHLEGDDFSERLNNYFIKLSVENDSENLKYYKDLFNRMRIMRNNVAHPRKETVDPLTFNELKECIDFTFNNIGGDVNE